MGLLGEIPDVDVAWPDVRSPVQAGTYMAAASLAIDDHEELLRLASSADLRARGAACTVTDSALAQMESGGRLCVVES